MKLSRSLIHIPHGAFPVFVAVMSDAPHACTLSVLWVVIFLTYQILQDRTISDKSYKDIYSFMIGFVLAVKGLFIYNLVT